MCQCVWTNLTVTKITSIHTNLVYLIVDYSIFTLLGNNLMQIKNYCSKMIYNTYITKKSTILLKIPEINAIRHRDNFINNN